MHCVAQPATVLLRLADDLRKCCRAAEAKSLSEAQRLEIGELRRRARAGLTKTLRRTAPGAAPDGGFEHEVEFPRGRGSRVRKYTIPSDDGLGATISIKSILDKRTQLDRPVIFLRRSLPSEYLERLALTNALFDDDYRF
ncbi:MAG: hypothetical protein ACI9R3_002754 [Verrucomicrobiales bacterium]|jgi:hypothetical protein